MIFLAQSARAAVPLAAAASDAIVAVARSIALLRYLVAARFAASVL